MEIPRLSLVDMIIANQVRNEERQVIVFARIICLSFILVPVLVVSPISSASIYFSSPPLLLSFPGKKCLDLLETNNVRLVEKYLFEYLVLPGLPIACLWSRIRELERGCEEVGENVCKISKNIYIYIYTI